MAMLGPEYSDPFSIWLEVPDPLFYVYLYMLLQDQSALIPFLGWSEVSDPLLYTAILGPEYSDPFQQWSEVSDPLLYTAMLGPECSDPISETIRGL